MNARDVHYHYQTIDPDSVPVIADLRTKAGIDGEPVMVWGYDEIGDAGDPWPMLYRNSGRTGQTMDEGNYVPGPVGDDYWEAPYKERAFAKRFGIKADYSSGTGTDNSLQLNRLFASEATYIDLQQGVYGIKGEIVVPNAITLDGRDAWLYGLDDWARDTHIMRVTASMGNRTWHLPGFQGVNSGSIAIPLGHENLACVSFEGHTTDCQFHLKSMRRMPVAFAGAPLSGAGFFAYNRIVGGSASGVATGLLLLGDDNVGETGWVNENSVHGFNITNSDNRYLGPVAGVRFDRRGPNGYKGQNNNTFFGCCFQVGQYDEADHNLTVGKTVVLHRRYTNRALDLDGRNTFPAYCCTKEGSGTLGTVPTHADGSEQIGANGWGFTHVGYWYRSPIWSRSGCGARNLFSGCRWEGGDGPSVIREKLAPQDCQNSSFEFYAATNNQPLATTIRTLWPSDVGNNNYSCDDQNTWKTYGRPDTFNQTTIRSLHLRAIRSDQDIWRIHGLGWRDYFVNSAHRNDSTRAKNLALCTDSLFIKSSNSMCFGPYINVPQQSVEHHFEIFHRGPKELASTDLAHGLAMFFKDKRRVAITGSTDRNFSVSSGTAPNTSSMFFAQQASEASMRILLPFPGNVDQVFFGMYNTGRVSDIIIQSNGHAVEWETTAEDFFGEDAVDPQSPRSSHGTPAIGIFQESGEYIRNADETAGNPVGWYVSTAGYLAPEWATGTNYVKNEIVVNTAAGSAYAAQADGTSGASPPTGTGFDLSDGNMLWRSIGSIAELQPTAEIYGNPAMSFQSLWDSEKTYRKSDVVRHLGWSSISKENNNSDYPTPISTGLFAWATGLGDSPSWSNNSQAGVPVYYTGLRIKPLPNTAAIIRALRIWCRQANDEHSIMLVDDPLGTPKYTVLAARQAYTENGAWVDVPIPGGQLLDTPDPFDLLLYHYSTTSVTENATYNYQESNNGVPSTPGDFYHRNNASFVRLHKTAVSGTLNLGNAGAGSTLAFQDELWTIVNVTDSGTYWDVEITPASRATTGTGNVQLIYPTAETINYVEAPGQLSGVTEVRGMKGVDYQAGVTELDDAFGIDLFFEDVNLSDKWRVLASV